MTSKTRAMPVTENEKEALYQRLMKAYSVKNLNEISSAIINAYRQKNDVFLLQLSRQIYGSGGSRKRNHLFTGLIMQFHPDRLIHYREQIQQHFKAGETGRLNSYTSIFRVLQWIRDRENENGEPAESSSSGFPDKRSSGHTDPDAGIVATLDVESEANCRNFVEALKHKEYGNLDMVYTTHDLQNMEGDLELSGYGISDLSGLEYCEHLTALDLSGNDIVDISAMASLTLLEEIDLSSNAVSRLDALSGMQYLRILDVAFNRIEDLSPLLELEDLEYVNCIGNSIDPDQIREFREKGVLIIFS